MKSVIQGLPLKLMAPKTRGCENISIMIRFVAEDLEVRERLLTIATASVGDAKTLANTIITELHRVG